MKDETIYNYRGQLDRKQALDMDQQRAIVDHAIEVMGRGQDKSLAMQRQEVSEKRNGMKDALADLRGALVRVQLYRGDDADFRSLLMGRAAYIAECMDQFLNQKKTKAFQTWDDFRVMIDEEYGDVA